MLVLVFLDVLGLAVTFFIQLLILGLDLCLAVVRLRTATTSSAVKDTR